MASVRKRTWTHKGVEREAWVVDYTDQSGKRRMKTFDKKKDADKGRQQIEAEIEAGIHTAPKDSVTVAAAIQEFMKDYRARWRLGDVAGNTINDYRSSLEVHVQRAFGARLLSNVTSEAVQSFVDGLRQEGYAANTVCGVYAALHTLLKYAVKKKWAKRNILLDEPCRLPARTRRTAIPSKDDIRKLLSFVADRRDGEHLNAHVARQVMLTLGVFGGLRPGEVYGLQWEAIDFERGVLTVGHSQSKFDGLKAPKTKAGYRTVPLSAPIIWALNNAARLHEIKRAAYSSEHAKNTVYWRSVRLRADWEASDPAGAWPKPSGYVLLTHRETPFSSLSAWVTWHKMMKDAGLVDPATGKSLFTAHALRHAAASLMIEAGLPAMNLREVIGHASVTTTYNVYGHLFAEDQRTKSTLGAIAEAFSPEANATRLRQISVSR